MSIDIPIRIVSYILLSLGLYKIFIKCGIDKRWAFVPIVRIYKLSLCARNEKDALLWLIFELISQAIVAVTTIVDLNALYSPAYYIITILQLVLLFVIFIYKVRCLSSLCKVFNRKKSWLILWIFADFIVALIWGFSSKFQPEVRVDGSVNENAASISGRNIKPSPTGLTVNINSRSVKDLFKKKYLLKDIHLNIESGKMVLLLGGSGAGKTTFVNAITGYEKADAKIYLKGKNVYDNFNKIKHDIGFVPQQDLMRHEDTVKNTVLDSAKLRLPANMKKSELKEKLETTLDIFGLRSVQDSLVQKESGGQKKRTSISMELIANPYLFILDEPDSGLDGVLARELISRLHDISREGKIVIVITHSPDRVLDLFDETIILAKDANKVGRLVFHGSVEETKAFFGKEKMEDVIKMINRKEEGGEGKADSLIEKYEETVNARQ